MPIKSNKVGMQDDLPQQESSPVPKGEKHHRKRIVKEKMEMIEVCIDEIADSYAPIHIGNHNHTEQSPDKIKLDPKKSTDTGKNTPKDESTDTGKNTPKDESTDTGKKTPEDEKKAKMHSRRKCHMLLFCFLLFMDIADMISDWLFYVDVSLVTGGLVYGPVDPAVVNSLLAFSITGTIMFTAELINLYFETWKGTNLVDSDLLSAIVVWIEDVPQIIISLYIALCRERAISVFQLTKAAVVLAGVVVRIIICSAKYCNPKAIKSHHHVKYKALIFIGIIVESLCAGAIFFLTIAEKSEDGNINFRVPQTLIWDEFDEQRYFAGAAVFVHQRHIFDMGQLDNEHKNLTVNWLRLAGIDDIRDKGVLHVKYEYERKSKDSFNLAVYSKTNDQNPASWNLSECYTINNQTAAKEQLVKTCSRFSKKSTSVIFTFDYEPPKTFFKERVFGDLTFNVKIKEGNFCRDDMKVSDNIEDETKLNATFIFTLHFYLTRSNPTVFYRNDGKTLVDVKDAWKTGWRKCPMTGYVGPPLNPNLNVPC